MLSELFQIVLPFDNHSSLLILAGVFLATYCLWLGIWIPVYNVTLHPLAKYPGPKLYAAFHFPYYFNKRNGQITLNTQIWHESYGEVVRIRPDKISFNTSQAWKDIYGYRRGKEQLPKDLPNYGRTEYGSTLVVADDENHARIRKILAPAFSERALVEQESFLLHHIELLMHKLDDKVEGPTKGRVDMRLWYYLTTFDLIGDLAFGQSFEGIVSGKRHPWITTMDAMIRMLGFMPIILAYPVLARLVRAFFSGKDQEREKHLAYGSDTVKKRLTQDTTRHDFLSYILRHNDENGMTTKGISETSSLLVLAGVDTTAALLTAATYYLTKNAHVLQTLANEIRTTFRNEADIGLVSSSQLKYLRAVVEESLRIYPPIPSGLPRRTVIDDEIISGYMIPRNTIVCVTQLASSQSPKNFASPMMFAPERWLKPIPLEYINDKRDIVQPFSVGPRNCVGQNLAHAEIRIILARLLWRFDIKLEEEGRASWEEQNYFKFRAHGELWVTLSRRREFTT